MTENSTLNRQQMYILVTKAARSDERALEELIDLFDKRLLHFVRRMIPDPNLAYDIVQESWVCVYRTLPRLREPHAFPSWLFQIARGKIALHYRSYGLRHEVALDAEVLDAIDDEERLSAEQAADVHRALSKLSLAHREILLLRFMEDFSMEEIASTLDIAVGSAKSRLHFAKRALREILERQERDIP